MLCQSIACINHKEHFAIHNLHNIFCWVDTSSVEHLQCILQFVFNQTIMLNEMELRTRTTQNYVRYFFYLFIKVFDYVQHILILMSADFIKSMANG